MCVWYDACMLEDLLFSQMLVIERRVDHYGGAYLYWGLGCLEFGSAVAESLGELEADLSVGLVWGEFSVSLGG